MNRPTRIGARKWTTPKKPTNVSLCSELVDAAKELGLNISEACQAGLASEVKNAREAAWKEENRVAIESWNEYTRKHGLPLAKYRQF